MTSQELFLPPAFASSHSDRPWRGGISLPQSRCRDGRRSHERTSQTTVGVGGLLRQIQCSSFQQYPILQQLVKAALANERPNVRRSPPGSESQS
eukprot:g3270.t1